MRHEFQGSRWETKLCHHGHKYIKCSNLISLCFQCYWWKLVLNQDVSALLWPMLCVRQNIIHVSWLAMELERCFYFCSYWLDSSATSKVRCWCEDKVNWSFCCNVGEYIQFHNIKEFKEERSPCCCFRVPGLKIAFAVAHSYNLENGFILI